MLTKLDHSRRVAALSGREAYQRIYQTKRAQNVVLATTTDPQKTLTALEEGKMSPGRRPALIQMLLPSIESPTVSKYSLPQHVDYQLKEFSLN